MRNVKFIAFNFLTFIDDDDDDDDDGDDDDFFDGKAFGGSP